MQYFQIEYFLGIVRNGTMNAAAKALNISQSTLSSALKNLENELGTPLFDRIGRNIVLNENGHYFLRQAESIEGLFNETISEIRDHNLERKNTVNCALYTPVGNLGTLIANFKKQYPVYSLKVGFPSSGVFGVFNENDIDISIIATPLHLASEEATLLGTEQYAIALPLNHPLAEKQSLKLSDFKNDDFVFSVGAIEQSCFDPWLLCEKAGFIPKCICEVQWQTDALQLVEAGVGCCIAPEFSWLANQSYNIIVRHFKTDGSEHRHLYAQLAQHKQASPASLAFLNYLKDYTKTIRQR